MQNKTQIKVKSVRKALDLLTSLVFDDPQRGGQALSVLAERHGLPSNTAHSLLQTMVACGYASQTEAGLYAAGDVCRQIGVMNDVCGAWTTTTLQPAMKEFSRTFNVNAVFAVLGHGRRIVVARSEGGGVIRVHLPAAENRSFYDLPTSRALVVWASDEERKQIVEENGLPGKDWDQIDSAEKLQAHITRQRKMGYVRVEDAKNGIFACSAAVLRADGSLLGTMGAYMPLYGLDTKQKKQLIDGLLALTESLRES
jgi:DNA-binding IclR family transcriptional regulator